MTSFLWDRRHRYFRAHALPPIHVPEDPFEHLYSDAPRQPKKLVKRPRNSKPRRKEHTPNPFTHRACYD